jgi:uncharacterized protein (TIGR00369 family)
VALDVGSSNVFSGGIDVNLLEHGRRVLEAQPFSRRVGSELVLLEPGRTEIALDVRDDLQQQHGFVHGGVVSYLADNALTFAGGSIFGDAVTVEYKINYARPAAGRRLIARAAILSRGKRQAVCECKVFAQDGPEEKLVAAAQGTIAKVADRDLGPGGLT